MRIRDESMANAIAGLGDVQAAMVLKTALLISHPRSRAMQLLKAVLRLEMAANGIPQSALLRDAPIGPDRD